MNQPTVRTFAGPALALALAAGLSQAQTVRVLPSLGGVGSTANNINDDGDVVGQSAMGDGTLVATRWDASGNPTALGMLTGTVSSLALAINNNGEVVGYSEEAAGLRKATYWDSTGAMTDMHAAIAATGSSIPWDINDNSLVVGQAPINPGLPKGFVWQVGGDALVAGGLPGYMSSRNLAVNNAADIVGSSFFFGDPDDAHLAVPDGRGGWESNQLGPTGFEFTVAAGISNSGEIVGYTTYNSTTTGWNAVIFDRNSTDVQVLGTLPNLDTSEAYDVNDNGVIVGQAWDGAGSGFDPRAWAWVDGTMYDLNNFLSEDSEFEILLAANAINEHNDIVGFGRLSDGSLAGFVFENFNPGGCPGDFNGDGELNFFDAQAFLNAFSAQDPSADFNDDGAFDFFDAQAFLQAFSDGCP